MRARRLEPVAYALCCLALWPIPLLNRLHVESAAVLSAAVFIVAGIAAVDRFRRRGRYAVVLRGRLVWLLLPLALMLVPMFWAPNCDWLVGLAFFGLFPVVTAVFSTSMAWALTASRLRNPSRWLVATGVLIVIAGPLYDLGWHPQFYTYNHVFGGVLGPLYDEEITWRPGLFVFRSLTLLWSLLFYLGGTWRRRRVSGYAIFATFVVAGLVSIVYLNPGKAGINTPAAFLQADLGEHVQTPHFDVYYSGSMDEGQLARLIDEHEFRFETQAALLGLQPDVRIQSYVYPDPETRVRLTGARYTSVAPVWLSEPQLHVLEDGFFDVFAHELAHVFSREMGLPVLRASLSVGLVEGFAGAIEPADGRPSASDQVAAATSVYADSALAAGLASGLSPWGFWTGRGAVSYATSASFIRYLLDGYGVAPFTDAYAGADFQRVYSMPIDSLAAGWIRSMRNRPWLARDAGYRAKLRFSVPSLAERRCPHHVPSRVRWVREADEALAAADTTAALVLLDRVLDETPDDRAAVQRWLQVHLAAGRYAEVHERIGSWADIPGVGVVVGDLAALDGLADEASARYDSVRRSLPVYARDSRVALWLRGQVADSAAAIRALHRADWRSLARLDYPAARALAARLALDINDAPAADSLLTGALHAGARLPVGTDAGSREWARRSLVWRGEIAYRLARPDRAAAFADSAAAAYFDTGDFEEAERMRDFESKMRWVSSKRADL